MSQDFNLANAKLNLSLKVVGKRSDGYHLLESLVVFLRLADDVEIGLANKGCHQADGMHLYGINTNSIPNNDKNIVLRALAIINRDILKNLPKYTISLTKRIPSGAGLGGGSADAATVIKAVAKKYSQHSNNLDTDVGCPGSKVEPINLDGIKSLGNDLYPSAVALCPEIAKLCQDMQGAEGCCYASMSGSGSSVFGLFDSLPLAYQAYRHMIDHPDGHWVCLTRKLDP